jgi:hypothetical protein
MSTHDVDGYCRCREVTCRVARRIVEIVGAPPARWEPAHVFDPDWSPYKLSLGWCSSGNGALVRATVSHGETCVSSMGSAKGRAELVRAVKDADAKARQEEVGR